MAQNALNDEQRQAVNHTEGPLLIVAGAGTGKTTVIVEKIKHLTTTKKARPEEILALTFTEKAAAEMEERVDREMPYGYFQMWISTFHSFADKILRSEGSHIGIDPGYKLLTQAETIIFLRENLFRFNLKYFRPLGNPQKFLSAILQHFSRLKDEDISPEEYKIWAQKQEDNKELTPEEKEKITELSKAYSLYQDLKIKTGYFDFSDLIFYLLDLFRKRPSIIKKYQVQFKYVLVDEFQDTNIAQYLLLKLLCPPDNSTNITVVGDDSQAIYKFRGASVSNILAFMKDYPQARQVTLKINYRSYQSVLDASYSLIQHNNPDTLEAQLGISKELTAKRGKKKDTVKFKLASTLESETEYVAKEILTLKKKEGYSFSDFAMLVRANTHAESFINAFLRHGIPYHFWGPGMLFKQPEVKDLISYLKVLYNIEDSVSLYRVITMDVFNVNQRDISAILAFSKKTNLPLLLAIEVILSFIEKDLFKPEYENYRKFIPLLHEESKIMLTKIYRMIHKHLKLLKKNTAGQILYYFLEDTGYIQKLITFNTEKDEKIANNITKFFNKLKTFESEHEDASVFAVVDYLDMSIELGESPLTTEIDVAEYDAVNIMTIHAAKGLEFPIVFLVNLTQGRFPTYEKREPLPIPTELIKEVLPQGDYHLLEERRLFYVGLTRAKDKVYLTSSQTYGEGKRERKISPFIIETIGEKEAQKSINIKGEEKLQLSIFDFKVPEEPVNKTKHPLNMFSFSQLGSFDMCPLQYKYQYLLKIPTQPSSATSFGDTIHKTFQKFYQQFLVNKSIGLTELLDIYKKSWTPVGYVSLIQQEKMKIEGENMLTKYFETFHNPETAIIDIEKLFKIKIGENLFISGKIDRVDKKSDGSIEIIDYKTGSKPDDKELKKSLQLSLYALAAMDEGLYNKKVTEIDLTFYYLQDMAKYSMRRTEEEMVKVKEEVDLAIDKIRSDAFLPKVGPWCKFCSYRMLCEAWQ